MLVRTMVSLLVYGALVCAQSNVMDPIYAQLWLYEGQWLLSAGGAAKPVTLVNQCGVTGKFFACQQAVNGKVISLVIFIPQETPGSYYTQSVGVTGSAGGQGELTITGERWVYTSEHEKNGQIVHHRTVNLFTGKDKIHYEQAESRDGNHWTITGSGDEVRETK